MTHDPHSTRHDAPAQEANLAEPDWEAIADRVDALAAAWERVEKGADQPPELADFLANVEPKQLGYVLTELVKVDLEHRWQRGCQPWTIEQYCQALPQLGPLERLPVDLLYEELQARIQAGEQVYEAEIHKRFPQQAAELCTLMAGMAISGSPTCSYFAETQQGSDVKLAPASQQQPFGDLQAGDQLDDFQLLTPLGSGAFARVFLARQISMERLVALKISATAGNEPQTLAQLDHPNVVRVFDQRACQTPSARLLYMEVAPGGTLYEVLKRLVRPDSRDSRIPAAGEALLDSVNQALANLGMTRPAASSRRQHLATAPWHEVVCQLGSELAAGLAYAHSRGVLHRDIKPANVLLTAECEPKLADFNVSFNGGRSNENPGDAFGGSLAYMSPEQLEACHPLLGGSPQQVRETSDIYATGVMLWELLCGRRPFRDAAVANETGQLLRLQRMIELRRNPNVEELSEQLPANCPPPLKQTLLRCLQPDKQDRFQTAGELSRALKLCLDPHCWQLLEPPTTRFGRFALRWPILTTILAGLLPNIGAAAFNYTYNRLRMLNEWPEFYARFDQVQRVINCVAFPLGVAIGAVAAVKTLRLVRQDSPAEVNRGASRVLRFGHFISLLLLSIWTLSGIAFPAAIGLGGATEPPFGFHLHFFTSLALCGAAATAYPYFLITWLATHYFVPALVRNQLISGPRREDLLWTAKLDRFYLALAGLTPMLGMFAVVAFGDRQDWALLVAGGAGLLGFGAMFLLERQLDLDLKALEQIAVD